MPCSDLPAGQYAFQPAPMKQCIGLSSHSEAKNAASCEVHSCPLCLARPSRVCYASSPFLPLPLITHRHSDFAPFGLRPTAAPKMDAEYGNGLTQAVEVVAGLVSAMVHRFIALAGRGAHANHLYQPPDQVHRWGPIHPRRAPTTTTTPLTGKL